MRFTKALTQSRRIHPVVPPVGIPFTFPAPVGGWNTRDPLAEMSPSDAIVLDNYYPTTGNAQLRGGSMPWATGMGTDPIETLMQWDGGSVQEMFAIANHKIYDVTIAGAVGAAVVSGLTNNRWNYTMMTNDTSGGARLVLVNGADDMRQYDGTAWHTINAVSAPIAITGIATNLLTNIWVYQKRLFFTQKNSTLIWFLPLGQFGGAADSFDLGPFLSLGGYIIAGATWTQQGLNGPQDLCVFISSRGQVIIYSGIDPTDAASWVEIGTYNVGSPIGSRCLIPTGADVAIICQDGIVGLSSIITVDRAASNKVALSSKIKGAYSAAVNLYANNFGWEAVSYPRANQVWFNIPYQEGVQQVQFVLSTLTGAWCRFTNLNANTWCRFKESLYFGNNAGQVWVADDIGESDHNQAIPGTWITAYNYLQNPAFNKNMKMIRPNIYSDPTIAYGIGLAFNLNEQPVLPQPQAAPPTTGLSVWNVATWDVDPWASSLNINTWRGVGGEGTSVAAMFTTLTAGYEVTISSIDLWFEMGGPL